MGIAVLQHCVPIFCFLARPLLFEVPVQPMPPINGMPGQIPLIGRQGPSREQQIQTSVMNAVHQLSLNIYSQLASEMIRNLDWNADLEVPRLHQLAKDARTAAKAYFEVQGITFEQKT